MEQTFLGVVERDGGIYIPWRGTNVYYGTNASNGEIYELGQNLIVTLEIDENTICAHVVKVELPTLEQLKKIKDELSTDWNRFELIFNSGTLGQRVTMLWALDQALKNKHSQNNNPNQRDTGEGWGGTPRHPADAEVLP